MIYRTSFGNVDARALTVSDMSSQKSNDARLKSSRNDDCNIIKIIEVLTQTLTLEQEKGKDYFWKKVILELLRRQRNGPLSEGRRDSDASITRNVQELKKSVQLLSKQLRSQGSTRFSFSASTWADVTREGVFTKAQRLRGGLSPLRKSREILVKMTERKEVKEVQNKFSKQILRDIVSVSTTSREQIVSLRKLSSGDVMLHATCSETRSTLERTQAWAKGIVESAQVKRRTFAVLTHDVRITLNISDQKTIIKGLLNDNARLHKNLEILRVVWLAKVVNSEKAHSSLIVEVVIEAMTNRLLDVSMLDSYQKCSCELFERDCRITQCFKCWEFEHMIKVCKNDEKCLKCAGKHPFEGCVASSHRRRCANCNESHELWKRLCLTWKLQKKRSEEAFRNRSTRYSKTSRSVTTFLPSLHFSLSLFPSLNIGFGSTANSASSADSIDLLSFSSTTSSLDVDESKWRMMRVKKRRIRFFSASSDPKGTTSENTSAASTQKRQIRRRDRLSTAMTILKVVTAQSQQQLQLTLWRNNLSFAYYSTTFENR